MMHRVCAALAAGTLLAASVLLPISGCGSSGESTFPGGGGDGDEAGTQSEGGGFLPNGDASADGGACAPGTACGDGGVCAGNVCCEPRRACGDVCCGAPQVCSFQKCVTPGIECRDTSDCAPGEYCEYSLGTATDGGVVDAGTDAAMCVGGVDRTGRCLPRPPECAPDAGPAPGGELTCLEKCEYRPPTPTFSPVMKYAWGGDAEGSSVTDVMMAPIVVELDDDDCDGKVTARDIPEIVFSTFKNSGYNGDGTLHAISIVNGAVVEKWHAPSAVNATIVYGAKHVAGGNFDGQPGNEVVACGADGKAHAFAGADGTALWATAAPVTCFMPSIADLDGDGTVEVIVEGAILDGATGAVEHTFTPALNGPFVVSDIDGDGQLDVVTSSRGYHADGTMFVDTGFNEVSNFPDTGDWKGPWAGIGDFDLDGKPEVIDVDNENHALRVWRYDAAAPQNFVLVRDSIDINSNFAANNCTGWGATHGGGPPTVADFDKDGTPDVALAGGIGYVVFDGKELVDAAVAGPDAILWSMPTTDCSSASTGSTVFDFDGDGKAEVVYSDEHRMRIYEGTTGLELASVCNTTATLSEFPIVADVDNDGHADIIVVSNGYNDAVTCDDGMGNATQQSGVRIFGDANGSWVHTRRVWNEHAYHVTNVEEDGTIPKNEPPNWKQPGLDNFRQNKQPGSEFSAPNLVVSVAPVCPGPSGVVVTVRNVGEALVPAGVVVGVYAGAPGSGTKLGTVTTTHALYPAESEPLELAFPSSPPPTSVYAVVDDGAPAHPAWHECRTDDNTSGATSTACGAPH